MWTCTSRAFFCQKINMGGGEGKLVFQKWMFWICRAGWQWPKQDGGPCKTVSVHMLTSLQSLWVGVAFFYPSVFCMSNSEKEKAVDALRIKCLEISCFLTRIVLFADSDVLTLC